MSQQNLGYLINVTTGDLKGLSGMIEQLQQIREIAQQGAEFKLAFSGPDADAFKASVTNAVREALKSAKAAPVQEMQQVAQAAEAAAQKLEKVVTLLERVAAAAVPGGAVTGGQPAAASAAPTPPPHALGELQRIVTKMGDIVQMDPSRRAAIGPDKYGNAAVVQARGARELYDTMQRVLGTALGEMERKILSEHRDRLKAVLYTEDLAQKREEGRPGGVNGVKVTTGISQEVLKYEMSQAQLAAVFRESGRELNNLKDIVHDVTVALQRILGNGTPAAPQAGSVGGAPLVAAGATADVYAFMSELRREMITAVRLAMSQDLDKVRSRSSGRSDETFQARDIEDQDIIAARGISNQSALNAARLKQRRVRKQLKDAVKAGNDALKAEYTAELEAIKTEMEQLKAGPDVRGYAPSVATAIETIMSENRQAPLSKALRRGTRYMREVETTHGAPTMNAAFAAARQHYVPLVNPGAFGSDSIDDLQRNILRSLERVTTNFPKDLFPDSRMEAQLKRDQGRLQTLMGGGAGSEFTQFVAAMPRQMGSLFYQLLQKVMAGSRQAVETGGLEMDQESQRALAVLKESQLFGDRLSASQFDPKLVQRQATAIFKDLYPARNAELAARAGQLFPQDPTPLMRGAQYNSMRADYDSDDTRRTRLLKEMRDGNAIPLTPVTLEQAREKGTLRQDEYTDNVRRLMDLQGAGYQFYVQSTRRRARVDEYLKKYYDLMTGIDRGELPSELMSMLAQAGDSRAKPAAFQEYVQQVSSGALRPSGQTVKIDPKGYADVRQGYETAYLGLMYEQMSGGRFGLPTDDFVQQRGRVVNGTPMLLTVGSWAKGRRGMGGELDPETGAISPNVQPFQMVPRLPELPPEPLRMAGQRAQDQTAGSAAMKSDCCERIVAAINDLKATLVSGGIKLNETGAGDVAGMADQLKSVDSVFRSVVQSSEQFKTAMTPMVAFLQQFQRSMEPYANLVKAAGGKVAEAQALSAVRVQTAQERSDIDVRRKERLLGVANLDRLQREADERRERAFKATGAFLTTPLDDNDVAKRNQIMREQDPVGYYKQIGRLTSSLNTGRDRSDLLRDRLTAAVDPDTKLSLETQLGRLEQTNLGRLLTLTRRLTGVGEDVLPQDQRAEFEQFAKRAPALLAARSGVENLRELDRVQAESMQRATYLAEQIQRYENAGLELKNTRQTLGEAEAAYDRFQTLTKANDQAQAQLRNARGAVDALPDKDAFMKGFAGVTTEQAAIQRMRDMLGVTAPREVLSSAIRPDTGDAAYDATKMASFYDMERARREQAAKQAEAAALAAQTRIVTDLNPGDGDFSNVKYLRQRVEDVKKEFASRTGVQTVEEAQKAVKALRDELAKVNADIGKTGEGQRAIFAKLSDMLGKNITSVDQLEKEFRELNDLFNKVEANARRAGAAVGRIGSEMGAGGGETGGWLNGLLRKFDSLTQYLGAGFFLYGAINTIRTTVTELNKLESALASVQGILDGRSPGSRDMVRDGAFAAAQEFGVTPLAAVQSARVFAQTGANAQESVALSRAALAGQVGLGIESNQATEMLIATRNIMGGQIEPYEILDRIARIEAQYAVSTQDLSTALQRVGSVAKQFQPNMMGAVDAFDTVIGATTSIVEKTRVSGNQAATSLRFMIARLAQPEVARKLQNDFDINLAGSNPYEMRALPDILRDVSRRYQEYMTPDAQGNVQSVKAADLLVTFAGARQTNAAAALLENFNKSLDIATTSALAYGDVQERVRIQMDTVEAKLGQFGAAFTVFFDRLVESSGLRTLAKGVLGGATSLLQGPSAQDNPALLASVGGAAVAFGAGLIPAVGQAMAGASWSSQVLGIFTKIGSFGTTLGWTGLILGGFAVAAKMLEYFGVIGEKFGEFESFDRAEFEKSDLFKDASKTASRYGKSADGMTDVVLRAAEEVIREQTDVYAKRGISGNIFTDRKLQERLSAPELERAFVAKLVDAGITLEDFKTDAEKAGEAMRILRVATQVGGAPAGAMTAQLESQIGNLTKELAENRSRYGEDLARISSMGAGGVGNNASNLLRKVLQAGSGVDALSFFPTVQMATGQTLAQYAMQNPRRNRSIGGVFDDFVNDNLRIGDSQIQSLLNSRRYDMTSASRLPKAEEVLASVQEELARIYQRNGVKYADAVAQATEALGKVRSAYMSQVAIQDELVGKIVASFRGQNRTVGGSDSGSGMDFYFSDEGPVQQAFRLAAKRANFTPEKVQQGINLLSTVTRADRPDTRAILRSDDETSSLLRFRERILKPMIDFSVAQADFTTNRRVATLTGRGFDAPQAQMDMVSQFYTEMRRVPTQLRGDRLQTAMRLAYLQDTNFQKRSALDYAQRGNDVADEGGRDVSRMVGATVSEVAQMNAKTRAEQIRRLTNDLKVQDEQMKMFFERGQFAVDNTENSPARDMMLNALSTLRQNMAELDTLPEELRTGKKGWEAFVAAITRNGASIDAALKQFEGAVAQAAEVVRQRFRQGILSDTAQRMEGSGIQLRAAQQRIALTGRIAQAELFGRQDLAALVRQDQIGLDRDTQLQMLESEQRGRRSRVAIDFGGVENVKKREDMYFQIEQEGQTRRVEILRQSYEQQLQLVQAEEQRIAAAREAQMQELLQGSTAGIREVLMDFDKLRGQPMKIIVAPIAQTFQRRIVDNFLDSIMGPMGVASDKLRTAFSSGATLTYSKVTSAHLDGMTAAAAVLRTAFLDAAAGAKAILSGGTPGGLLGGGSSGVVDPSGTGSMTISQLEQVRLGTMGVVGPGDLKPNPAAMSVFSIGGPSTAGKGGKWKNFQDQALMMGGQIGGSFLGSATGVRDGNNYASEGASIGTTIGSMTPLGPVGGFIGGILGGFVGGRFGKGKDDKVTPELNALERIERNTREQITAIENQTSMLALDSRFLNVPAGFVVPSYTPFGVGGGAGPSQAVSATISITVNPAAGQSEAEIGNQVASAIRQELGRLGTSFDVRSM